MSVVIQTTELTKIYEGAWRGQDVHALDKLNLEVHSGEIFGYLGPNGSGKTTTIKMLLGLIFPTSGGITILGSKNIGSASIRKKIGYVPDRLMSVTAAAARRRASTRRIRMPPISGPRPAATGPLNGPGDGRRPIENPP